MPITRKIRDLGLNALAGRVTDPVVIKTAVESPLQYQVVGRDVTPAETRLRNEEKRLVQLLQERREANLRTLGLSLPCLQKISCRWQPWCCQTNVNWYLPNLKGAVYPVSVDPLNIHIRILSFKAWMDGTVQVGFRNDSEEGKKVTTVVCQCRGGNPSSKTEPVSGSADVTRYGTHSHTYGDLNNAVIDQVKEELHGVVPNDWQVASATFRKDGLWPILQYVLDRISGWVTNRPDTIRVSAHIDDVWHVNWLGKDYEKDFTWDTQQVPLGVGDFKVDWGLF